MKNLLIVSIIIVLLSACSSGWDNEYKTMYKDQCSNVLSGVFPKDSIPKYCDCALEKIMLAYPNQGDAVLNSTKLDSVPGLDECRDKYWVKYR